MRTSSKIVALMATQSQAFFTELFFSETVETCAEKQTASFAESLYSANDFVYYNWYDGYYVPIYYDGCYYGDFEGPYGGDVSGYIDYFVYGTDWYLDGVYSVVLTADYVSEFSGAAYGFYYTAYGFGSGDLKAIYAPSEEYWNLLSYGDSSFYLGGYYQGFWGNQYYFTIGYQEGYVSYQSYYNDLNAFNAGSTIYGYGYYDDLVSIYYYGYYEYYQLLEQIQYAYAAGLCSVSKYPLTYGYPVTMEYYGIEFDGYFYSSGAFYIIYYGWYIVQYGWGHELTYGTGYSEDTTYYFAVDYFWTRIDAYGGYYEGRVFINYYSTYTWGSFDGEEFGEWDFALTEWEYYVWQEDTAGLGSFDWNASAYYYSSNIDATYWIEYMATDLIDYFYAYV